MLSGFLMLLAVWKSFYMKVNFSRLLENSLYFYQESSTVLASVEDM